MYYAMDELGIENTQAIKQIRAEADRWKFIYDIAKGYGFEGVHFTPSLYQSFNLDLNHIPDCFHDFRLTFHLGGMHIFSSQTYDEFDRGMENAYEIARKHKMHDISLHPPYIHKLTAAQKEMSLELFCKAVNHWLHVMDGSGISVSLETHVAGEWFLFDGLHEYVKFVDQFPDLGVLVDISHNYYEPQYSEDDILRILAGKNITGLHISDALRSAAFEKGTHLPIGEGTIDFSKLLNGFENHADLYGVLEIKASNAGIERSLSALSSIERA